MLDQIIATLKPQIMQALASKVGLTGPAAEKFLGGAMPLITSLLGSGKLDAGALMKGGASGLVSKLDAGSLAGLVGGDKNKANMGLMAIAEPLMSHLGGNQNVLQQVLGAAGGGGGKGGLLGAVGNLASGILKK